MKKLCNAILCILFAILMLFYLKQYKEVQRLRLDLKEYKDTAAIYEYNFKYCVFMLNR